MSTKSDPRVADLVIRILNEADIAGRPGQYDRLNQISKDVEQMISQRAEVTSAVADLLRTVAQWDGHPDDFDLVKATADAVSRAYAPERDAELAAWYKTRENVTYTDGSRVQEGDQIRYHQAPGGLMAHGDWRYGTAARLPEERQGRAFRIDELHLLDVDGHYYGLCGHVIERVS